jgi:hypothetical protein
MRTITIKKDQNKSNELYSLILGKQVANEYLFDENCVYDLGSVDQDDWNKLFGFTDCLLPRLRILSEDDDRNAYSDFSFQIGKKTVNLFMPWHWKSARFVWRYNIQKKLFEISHYTYINGERSFEGGKVYELFFNKKVTMKIEKDENIMFGNRYIFTIRDYKGGLFYSFIQQIPYRTNFFGIYLPAFFGGNRTAPNTIKIQKSDANY